MTAARSLLPPIVAALLIGGLLLLVASPPARALSVVGIEGPARAASERSCYELSAEISELLEARDGTAGFWSRADTQFAGVMTVVTPVPAIAYLGYSAFEAVKQDQAADDAAARVRALRKRSAEQRCFAR